MSEEWWWTVNEEFNITIGDRCCNLKVGRNNTLAEDNSTDTETNIVYFGGILMLLIKRVR
jgi:hypothetical protein